MEQRTEVWIGPRQCKYAFRGKNLAELRRAQLRKVARGMKLSPSPEATKQQMLKMILAVAESGRIRLSPKGIHRVDDERTD